MAAGDGVQDPAAPAPATGEPIAATAYNGAQVQSLVEIVQAVADGTLPADSAREIVAAAYPSIAPEAIDRMLGAAASKAADDGRGKFNEAAINRVGGKFAPKGAAGAPAGSDVKTKETAKPKSKEEKAREREIKKARAKAERISKLSAGVAKLKEAWRSLESKPGNEKLQNKIKAKIDKMTAKIEEITTGKKRNEEDGLLAEAAAATPKAAKAGDIPSDPGDIATGKRLIPISELDPVGRLAYSESGAELGAIERVHRFGTVDGIEATKAEPVYVVAGAAHRASSLRVRL
jgi:hypothetical protein